MIKAITILQDAGDSAAFARLTRLFDSLGFESGQGSIPGEDRTSSFVAPKGQIEFFHGEPPWAADVMIEVSDLETVHNLVHNPAIYEAGDTHPPEAPSLVTGIVATEWGGRFFYLEPAARIKIAFWEWEDGSRRIIDNDKQVAEGKLLSNGMRFGIVVARWNSFITDRLLQGAWDALHRTGANPSDIRIVRVPGSFEIPSAARKLAQSGGIDAVICLGCLIRGETTHYEHISAEVTRGIGQSAQETGIPHTYGVLTCENLEQAIDRAGLKGGNKGFEAAISAVEMVSLHRHLAGAHAPHSSAASDSTSTTGQPDAANPTAQDGK